MVGKVTFVKSIEITKILKVPALLILLCFLTGCSTTSGVAPTFGRDTPGPELTTPRTTTPEVGSQSDDLNLQKVAGKAPTLWQGTRYGMTVDEVRAMFPKCRDKSFAIGGLKTVGPLEEDAEIAGYHFQVQFYFTAPGNRLDRVILRCADRLTNDQGAAVARHFVELLQGQYGEGKISEDQDISDARDIDRIWITKDFSMIRLSFFQNISLGAGVYQLSITYDGGELRGVNKL